MSDNREVIVERFEQCLIDGLQGQPIVGKDGPVTDPQSGEVLVGPPDSSFLSVVRAYIKDTEAPGPGKPKSPLREKAGEFQSFGLGKPGLPFAGRPN